MRLHIVGLPHTDVSRDWEHCAYTMKIHRLIRMMADQNIDVFLYAGTGTDEETQMRVAEDVPIVGIGDRQAWWGQNEWPKDVIFNEYDGAKRHWTEMNSAAAIEIAARWKPGDILGIIAGLCQEQIVDELASHVGHRPATVEWGIGYPGVLTESYKVFESSAWRHHVAGLYHDDNLRWYDTVIPNAYDHKDFLYRSYAELGVRGLVADGPLVFMARMTERKGLGVVRAIAATGKYEVITCGQGDERIDGAEHRGLVTGEAKKELLHSALAVLSPTTYLGPFEGVSVEAMMAGTPAITTDWGCYIETIPDHYRATTLQEFLDAIELARTENRFELQRAARRRFGLDTVGAQYADYFHKISALSVGIGWDYVRTPRVRKGV